jgi:hypothetical protein
MEGDLWGGHVGESRIMPIRETTILGQTGGQRERNAGRVGSEPPRG